MSRLYCILLVFWFDALHAVAELNSSVAESEVFVWKRNRVPNDTGSRSWDFYPTLTPDIQ